MAGGAGALPSDDVLRDIFSRLPEPVDLVRCAATCRRWLRLLGDPAFHSRWENGRRASYVLGVFSQIVLFGRPSEHVKRKQSLWPPQFERLYAPFPAGPGASKFSFFFPNDGGLLLLRIKPAPFDSRKLHLAVCHPVIGKRSTRLLPPPPLNVDPRSGGDDVAGYGLVTAADHRTCCDLEDQQRHPAAFQVLFTAIDSDEQLRAYSYSSTTGTWSAAIKCPLQVSDLTMSGPRAGTVADGTVHWLYRDATSFYTLDVAMDSEHAVSLTKIPIQVGHDPRRLRTPFPCTVRGKLSFVNQSDIGKLELWTKQENIYGAGGWLCSELLHEPAAKNITVFAFLESKGAMLIRIVNLGTFTVDLESKELDPGGGGYCTLPWYARKLCGDQDDCRGRNSCDDCTYNKRVIYEMDWPSYFLHLYGPKEQEVQQGEADASS